ncbi:MAG TPA: polysaccharide biosynthesis C-terminal domain-containing protein [Opitutaceae bacterium]|jgi:O-antigen/teichoic acid export membrane protein|nr:polysaccharide biosynthesis C-terminal domain-containing protein [Opitutaceae bacterium]
MKLRAGPLLNSLTQVGARTLGAISSLVLSWLIARHSAGELGVFRTLFSYLLMGDFVALLGMQTYVMREVSLHPQNVKKHGLHALIFAQLVALAGVVLMIGLAFFGHGYSRTIGHGLFFVAGSLPATAASLVGVSILVGLGRAPICSFIQGTETAVRTLVGIVLVVLGYGIVPVIGAMCIIRLLLPVAYWFVVKPSFSDEPGKVDWSFFRNFLGQVPIFAGITSLAMVLRFAAPLTLPWMLNDAAAGQFGAAFIFIDLVMMVPTKLTINLMPVLARKSREKGSALNESCRQGIKAMAMGVLPISAILAVVAPPMFASVFPGKTTYAISATVLQVVIWTCCLQSIDQVLSAAIVAKGKQHIDLQTLSIGATSMILLLAILVPLFGIMGAAFAVLGAIAFQLVVRFILVGRQIGALRPFELLWRPVLATIAAMAAAMVMTRIHWLVGAAAGGLAYGATLGMLGAFARGECDDMMRLLQAEKA